VGVRGRSRVRDLRERHVLGEAAGGEALRLAGEQRQERPPRGIGPGGAAREEGRDRGAAERLFQMRPVLGGRAEEDGHPVEGHAARRLGLHAARDLDALACLARPGGEGDAVVERGRRGLAELEEVRLERVERARPTRSIER